MNSETLLNPFQAVGRTELLRDGTKNVGRSVQTKNAVCLPNRMLTVSCVQQLSHGSLGVFRLAVCLDEGFNQVSAMLHAKHGNRERL